MSTVIVKNIPPSFLFEFFYFSIMESCGDGSAVICCGNPTQTSEHFIHWWKKKYLPEAKAHGYRFDEFYHKQDMYEVNNSFVINYHDSNENFMFSDSILDADHGDISFIVEEDCKEKGYLIKKVENE